MFLRRSVQGQFELMPIPFGARAGLGLPARARSRLRTNGYAVALLRSRTPFRATIQTGPLPSATLLASAAEGAGDALEVGRGVGVGDHDVPSDLTSLGPGSGMGSPGSTPSLSNTTPIRSSGPSPIALACRPSLSISASSVF